MNFSPPRYACEGLLWFILFFAPAAFGATEWWSIVVLEALIFLLAAMCALRRDFSAPLGGPLWGFFAILLLGVFQLLQVRAANGPAGFLPFTSSRSQTAHALLLWAAWASLYWASSGLLRWEGALRRLAWVIFGTGLFIAAVGLVQRGAGNTAYYGLRPVRHGIPFGPFTNANHAANWLAASTLVGAGLFAERLKHRGRGPRADRLAQHALAAFILCLSIASVVATGSRGGSHAFVLAVLLTAGIASVPAMHGRFRVLVPGGLILAGLAYTWGLYLHPRWIGLVGGAIESSAGYRVSMYRSGLRMLADFPIFGVGLGGFQRAFTVYKEQFVFGAVDHIHSSWFEVALESGLVGAAAFGAFALAPLAAYGRRLAREGFPLGLRAGCFAAVLALVIHGLVEFSFQIPADAALVVVLLAAVSSGLTVMVNRLS